MLCHNPLNRLKCKISKAPIGIVMSASNDGFVKPKSQLWPCVSMIYSQKLERCSKHQVSQPLGICINSVKKIREENNRKSVKIGPKIRLPMGESRESGSPQQSNMGKAINEIKSCNWANRKIHCIAVQICDAVFIYKQYTLF